jgi:hypothetical protein
MCTSEQPEESTGLLNELLACCARLFRVKFLWVWTVVLFLHESKCFSDSLGFYFIFIFFFFWHLNHKVVFFKEFFNFHSFGKWFQFLQKKIANVSEGQKFFFFFCSASKYCRLSVVEGCVNCDNLLPRVRLALQAG